MMTSPSQVRSILKSRFCWQKWKNSSSVNRSSPFKVNAFFADDWVGYQQAVEAAEVSLFETFEPLDLEQ